MTLVFLAMAWFGATQNERLLLEAFWLDDLGMREGNRSSLK
jgi:hypothetical protein